jgi:hypothetical protein
MSANDLGIGYRNAPTGNATTAIRRDTSRVNVHLLLENDQYENSSSSAVCTLNTVITKKSSFNYFAAAAQYVHKHCNNKEEEYA